MLKGHVFSKQLFENPIFALFINTFLNGENGVSNNYKNGMQVTYSGSTLTIDSGAICIQGRFLEEDTSTPIATGTNNAYCKLVIEIDLDKQNTESQLNQASYKVITSASGYPNLTQTNIVKNVAGIYQYELARFRTSASGITDFQDMRTFLDFNTIYAEIRKEYGVVLQELKDELANVVDGSDYLLKSAGGTVQGEIVANGGVRGNVVGNVTGNVSGSSGSCTGNAATATKATTATTAGTCTGNAATSSRCKGNSATATKLQTTRTISLSGDVSGSASFDGSKNVTINTDLANIAVLTGTITVPSGDAHGIKENISYPTGYTQKNCVPIAVSVNKSTSDNLSFGFCSRSTDWSGGAGLNKVMLTPTGINLYTNNASQDLISGKPVGTAGYSSQTVLNYKIVLMKI